MSFNISVVPSNPFIHQIQDFLPGATFYLIEDQKHYMLLRITPGVDCDIAEINPANPELGVSIARMNVDYTKECILTEIISTITFPAQ